RVRAAAEDAGCDFKLSMRPPDDDVAKPIGWVILDLSTRSGLTEDIAGSCESACPNAKLIAYGPHVQVARLSAARQAGISTVLTRGQFDAMLASMFV
ncbi:MAG: histidine kinase, partial [Planctomycetota bacterium]